MTNIKFNNNLYKDNIMSKSKAKSSTVEALNSKTILSKLDDITEAYLEIATDKVAEQAEGILESFASNDDKRQKAIASLKVQLKSVNEKIAKAEKAYNKIGLTREAAGISADIAMIEARRAVANESKGAFCTAFSVDPYQALAEASVYTDDKLSDVKQVGSL